VERERQSTMVLGGTGKTGRRVARRLAERGIPARIGSRSGAPPFDWEDRQTWAPALQDVDAVYLAYQRDVAAPGAAEAIRGFAELAVSRGVRRIVLLSGRGEEEALPSERAVRESGARFTILRSAYFCQNFDEGPFADAVRSGELAFLAGVAEPFVDAEDLADVAVAALTDDAHAGRTYELTGPRLLTFAQAIAEISAAAGREIRYVRISKAAYAAALAPYLPPDDVTFLTDLFERTLEGRNAHLTEGVERVLGRRPRDFTEYARAAAATGAWSAGVVPQAAP
jgi:uncharacterized protein YbjT (DUF2867 family)